MKIINKMTLTILAIVLISMMSGCSFEIPTDVNGPSVTSTVAPTLAPTSTCTPTMTPTMTPSPTPLPLATFESLNDENTLYKVALSEELPEYCEYFELYNYNGTPLLVYAGEWNYEKDNKIFLMTFNPANGEVLNKAECPVVVYQSNATCVTEEGLFRIFDVGSYTYYYFDENLKFVRQLSVSAYVKSDVPYLTTDDSTVFYCYTDYELSKRYLGAVDIATGVVTDYSEFLGDGLYPSLETVLFNDRVMVINMSNSITLDRYYEFINVGGYINDSVAVNGLTIKSEGSDFSACYMDVFPELLIGNCNDRDNVLCYQYKDTTECCNYMYVPGVEGAGFLITVLNEETATDENSHIVLLTTLSCMSPSTDSLLYKTTSCIPDSIVYYMEPDIYIEDENWVLGVADDYNNNFIYLWDLSAENTEPDEDTTLFTVFVDPQTPDQEELDKMQKRADEIGLKYGVNIKTGLNCEYYIGNYTASPTVNLRLISKALDIIDETLAKYPSNYFKQLGNNGTNTLTFYLVASLRSTDANALDTAGALFTYHTSKQSVAIDVTSYLMLEQNIYHEISHATDWYIYDRYTENGGYNALWDTYRPEGFEYEYSYISGTFDFEYCYSAYEIAADDVYFIDYYSKTFPTEDRARLAEYVYLRGVEAYAEYPHIIEKLECMYNVICEVFDTSEWNGDFFTFDEYFGEGK